MLRFEKSAFRFIPAMTLAALLSSCGSDRTPSKSDVELPAWLTESQPTSTATDTQLASDTPSATLSLNLQVGDRFPLRKTVQQELNQETLSGQQTRNFSQLEMLMAISVKERRDNQTKLSVRYDRVKYRHEVADEKVEFDSIQSDGTLPLGVVAYRDMVGDGFSFWIGTDNQIAEVEGLTEFVNRCLRNVPPEHRKEVVLGIEAGSGESGIANFVDNTIGLLPYGRKTAPGDSWEREQQVARPVPMHISNVYTLKELSPSLAVVDIRGTITPSTTLSTLEAGNGLKVMINGGSTLGSCTIYRETGLPKESRVDRIMQMTVVMDNAVSFRQTKRITTTVESFPASNSNALPGNMRAAAPGTESPIQQVSGEYLAPADRSIRPR